MIHQILGGEALPFPVISGAWIAWAGDGVTELEIIAANQGYRPNIEPGKEPIIVPTNSADTPSGWHVAISTDLPAVDIVRIAREAGWQAEICDRAGYFSLVEVWIDGKGDDRGIRAFPQPCAPSGRLGESLLGSPNVYQSSPAHA